MSDHFPKNRTRWLIPSLILVTLALLGGAWWNQQTSADQTTRRKLETLLGEAPVSPAPGHSPAPPPAGPMEHPWQSLGQQFPGLGLIMPDSAVKVGETAQAYVLKVPLNNPAEAENIKLNVTPHHVEISGSLSLNENGSSTFFQSFDIPAEVLPSRIRREFQGKTLVLTIPKRHADQPATSPEAPQHAETSPPTNQPALSPEALEELRRQQEAFPQVI